MLSALIQSRLRYPAVRLAAQLVNRRSVHHGPLVLVTAPRKTPTPTIDRDRTVSRRSEPSSRATLMGEQPNPWDLLQPQDVTSRHRGANHPVDMSSWGGSACYPRSTFYPLSDGVSIHIRRITMPQFPACSACLPPSQAPLCIALFEVGYQSTRGHLWKPPLRFWRRPPQSNYPPSSVRASRVRPQTAKGPYFKDGSTKAGAPASKPPAYPTHRMTKVNAKL